MLADVWVFLFGFFPTWFQLILLVTFIVDINLIIFKVIAMILDDLPFI